MSVSEIHRLAALDNAALCSAMWRAHGLGVEHVDRYAACSGAPPRFYPNVVTVDPDFDPPDQLRSIAGRMANAAGDFSVKDSFNALALNGVGLEPLFEASWIHRPAGLSVAKPLLDWRRVTHAEELAAWEAAWSDDAGEGRIFLPAFLAEREVAVRAGWSDDNILAGCVVTVREAVAGISNVFGHAAEAINAAASAFPSHGLVGYETGEALATALSVGFRTVGDLVVWVRR